METWVWVVAIAAVAVVAVLAWMLSRKARSRGLQQEFGSEYERTMARAGDRGVAEADLMERRERVSALDVRPLSRADRIASHRSGRRCRRSSWTRRRRRSRTRTS